MTPLEAYAWMAAHPAPRPAPTVQWQADTQTMTALPAWLAQAKRTGTTPWEAQALPAWLSPGGYR